MHICMSDDSIAVCNLNYKQLLHSLVSALTCLGRQRLLLGYSSVRKTTGPMYIFDNCEERKIQKKLSNAKEEW